VIRDLLILSSKYFTNIHSILHYGYKKDRDTNDEILKGIRTVRLSTSNNVDLLLSKSECYSTTDPTCETLSK
jgi:hypothetical protein